MHTYMHTQTCTFTGTGTAPWFEAANPGHDNTGDTSAERGTFDIGGMQSMGMSTPLQEWPTVWEIGPSVTSVRPEFGKSTLVYQPEL